MKIRFVNTFDTSAPFLGDVLGGLEARGIDADALVADVAYRGRAEQGRTADSRWRLVRMPPGVRGSKRLVTLAYIALAPFHLARGAKPGAVVFLTQPPFFFVLGAAICRLRRIPYLVHVMDLHPDLLGCLGLLREGGVIYRVLARATTWALRGAAAVFAIGRCMEARLVRAGVDPGKIRLTGNWAPRHVGPIERADNAFLREQGWLERCVVLYMGNMGHGHEFGTVLEAARRLGKDPRYLFVFVGRGSRRREVQEAIEAGADNVVLLGHQPLDRLPQVLGSADVHFISLREGFEGVMVPSKFYSAVATGRPVIYEGSDAGEVARLITEQDCGSVIEPGDVEALVGTLERYRHDAEAARAHAAGAVRAHHSVFAADVQVADYIRSLSGVLGFAVPAERDRRQAG